MAKERSKNREEGQAMEPHQQTGISKLEPWSTFSPFGMMRRFSDEMDRMMERMVGNFGFPSFERFPSFRGHENFSPEIDMFERNGKLVITTDLPGLNKDDVKVDVTENAVIIEGERKYEHEEREEGIYRTERSYGHFRRQIPLPEGVKTDTASANFKNGVLEITMDAAQLGKQKRRIQIQGEPGGERAA
jgi:HSP20 family protein